MNFPSTKTRSRSTNHFNPAHFDSIFARSFYTKPKENQRTTTLSVKSVKYLLKLASTHQIHWIFCSVDCIFESLTVKDPISNMYMGKRLSLIFCLLAYVTSVSAQVAISPKIKWLTFEEAELEARQAKAPRKLLVELYTDKCGWCKKMDLSTFQNEFIAHYVNENFYPVKFNAELRKDIHFNSQIFKLDKSGYHELAIALTMGDLAFPTLVFLDEDYQIIQPIQGYQTVDELERIMFYFANNMHKTTPWNTFVQHYQPTNSKPRIETRGEPDHLLIIPVPPPSKSKGEVIKKKN